MDKRRLFHLFSILWLGLAATSFVGHYLADAAGFKCQVNMTGVCLAEEGTPGSQSPDENAANSQALHAGFDLPPVIPLATGPAMVLAIAILILTPPVIKSPPLPLPPQ